MKHKAFSSASRWKKGTSWVGCVISTQSPPKWHVIQNINLTGIPSMRHFVYVCVCALVCLLFFLSLHLLLAQKAALLHFELGFSSLIVIGRPCRVCSTKSCMPTKRNGGIENQNAIGNRSGWQTPPVKSSDKIYILG